MFNYQPAQYNHIKCSYHRIFHTVKNTQYGGHEECFHVGQCVSPPQCALYESCPTHDTHETCYEEETPNYSFYYVPHTHNSSPISHNIPSHKTPSNYISPNYMPAPEAHFQRKVEESRVPNVTVKRTEKKKKSKQPKCHCLCNQNKSPFSEAVPTPASIPTFPVQLLPSMSDWTYYWIIQLLEHMGINNTEQNQKFATAICEYFKFSTPQNPSISSLLQEIAERTKKDTNIKVEVANNEPEIKNDTKNDTKTADIWMDAVTKIGNESGDPRIKQFAGLMTDAVKISQNPEGQNGLAKVFTDFFMKNINDALHAKDVKVELKPVETKPVETKPVETKPESHPVDPVTFGQSIGSLLRADASTLNSMCSTIKNLNEVLKGTEVKTETKPVEKNCVAEADNILNEYIQQSDASILDTMNEARINKALEDMD